MTVAYSAASVTVRDGAQSAVFTVTRTGTAADLGVESSVAFATQDITATAGTDYQATSGTLEFAAQAVEAQVEVTIEAAAFDNTAVKTFLLNLTNFGAATGSISPDTTTNSVQTYLYIPDDDNSQTVPTADDPGDNLKWQAVYSGFSDPDTSTVEMPLGYLRLGYARSDTNDYERVILNSDGYHPTWNGKTSSGKPKELGTLENLSLPRGIDRLGLSSDDVDAEKKDNTHLDGIFLYSDKNYLVTINNHMNQVIQGDYIHFVGGRSHQLYMGTETKWTYFDGPKDLRGASGTDHINGDIWQYDISNSKKLGVSANQTIDYAIGAAFSASAAARLDVSNSVSYNISNSIGMSAQGLLAAISADVYGNFSYDTPTGGRASTKTSFKQAVSEEIVLSVNSGLSTAWTAPVKVAAYANAAAALGATTAAWLDDFQSNGKFFSTVTGEGLGNNYNNAFVEDVPNSLAGLAAATAAIVALSAASQKAAQTAAAVMPMLEMDATTLKLSAGADSYIEMTDETIVLAAPSVEILTDEMSIDADEVSVMAPEFTLTGSMVISTDLEVGVDLSVSGDAEILGEAYGTFIESG